MHILVPSTYIFVWCKFDQNVFSGLDAIGGYGHIDKQTSRDRVCKYYFLGLQDPEMNIQTRNSKSNGSKITIFIYSLLLSIRES